MLGERLVFFKGAVNQGTVATCSFIFAAKNKYLQRQLWSSEKNGAENLWYFHTEL